MGTRLPSDFAVGAFGEKCVGIAGGSTGAGHAVEVFGARSGLFATTAAIIGEVGGVGGASVADQGALIFVGGDVVAVPFFFGITSDLGAFAASVGVVAIEDTGEAVGALDASDTTAELAFSGALAFVPMAFVLACVACRLSDMDFECADVSVFGLSGGRVGADGGIKKGTHGALACARTVGDGFVDEVFHDGEMLFAFCVRVHVDGVEVVVGVALVIGCFVFNAVFGEFAFGGECVVSCGVGEDREHTHEVFDALSSGVLEADAVVARGELQGDAFSALGVIHSDGCAMCCGVSTFEGKGVAVADFAGEAVEMGAITTDKAAFQRLITAPIEGDVSKPRRDRAGRKRGFVALGGLSFFAWVHTTASGEGDKAARQQKSEHQGFSLEHGSLLGLEKRDERCFRERERKRTKC